MADQEFTTTFLMPFAFDTHTIRVHLDAQGEPWWTAKDVCDALALTNPSETVSRLKTDESTILSFSENGIPHTLLLVNEMGLYRLIFRSNKKEAQIFQDWVFRQVLPQIRKTGAYRGAPTLAIPAEIHQAMIQVMQALPLLVQTVQGMAVGLQSLSSQVQGHATEMLQLAQRVEQVEAAQDHNPHYFTIMGYAKWKHLRLSLAEARQYGLQLRQKAKEVGVKLGKVPDERWGTVNSYPVELLDDLFLSILEARQFLDASE